MSGDVKEQLKNGKAIISMTMDKMLQHYMWAKNFMVVSKKANAKANGWDPKVDKDLPVIAEAVIQQDRITQHTVISFFIKK